MTMPPDVTGRLPLAQEGGERGTHAFDRELCLDSAARGDGASRAPRRIIGQTANGSGERGGVAPGDELTAILGLAEDLPRSRGVRQNRRQPAGHRLQRRYRKALVPRGHHVEIGRRQFAAHRLAVAAVATFPA